LGARALSGYEGTLVSGTLVAVVIRSRVYLAPEVSALPRGNPTLRFVAAMCLYSHDVDHAQVPGPYSDCAAELYARCVLMPDSEFHLYVGWSNEAVAWRFGVALGQVAAKRLDLVTSAKPGRDPRERRHSLCLPASRSSRPGSSALPRSGRCGAPARS
jgi:hypothetical protein